MPDIICFDLCDTLADTSHRTHLIPPASIAHHASSWDRFSLACGGDAPITATIRLLVALSEKFRIFIWTSRGDIARAETVAWLERYGVPYDRLIMRGPDEHRKPEDVKADWLRAIGPEHICCAFDDNDDVVRMLRSMGITCLQVADFRPLVYSQEAL
ncbi:phosphatase domain-containing protein [Atlantibacter hermannii]|uniref:phosphatase domain-containing protein n=1 Tax=Atlantibacter hermannii TaxID=565 RepID=UPI00289D5865|nr:hypothetical protein [Atlantibacter hermannii]